MALDPDALRLAEELLQYATQHVYGRGAAVGAALLGRLIEHDLS